MNATTELAERLNSCGMRRLREGIMKFEYAILTLIELLIVYDSQNPYLILDENQWLYASSTIAQVMATVMGLLLAGYQFYEERLSRKIEQDATRQDSIEEAKKVFHEKLRILTPLVILDVLLCIASIILWKTGYASLRIANNFCFNNEVFLFIISLVLIMCFIINVTDPTAIQKISDAKRKDIERKKGEAETDSQRREDVVVEKLDPKYRYAIFLQEFNTLENMIVKAAQKLNKKHKLHIYNKRTAFVNGIETIGMYYGELGEILQKVDELRRYRNYLVHGTGENDVPQEMIDDIKYVNYQLHNELAERQLVD